MLATQLWNDQEYNSTGRIGAQPIPRYVVAREHRVAVLVGIGDEEYASSRVVRVKRHTQQATLSAFKHQRVDIQERLRVQRPTGIRHPNHTRLLADIDTVRSIGC